MAEDNAVVKEPTPALPELKINQASDGKSEIRTKVWDYLSDHKLTSFPWPPHKRIPNFKGAEEAGDRAITLEIFGKAQAIKVDPDKPLQEIRVKALEEKKTVLVPTPRLRYGFLNKIVPPADADKRMLKICASRQGFSEYSSPVGLDDNVKVDLLLVGAVAVSPKGWRIGKGEGYSDLEYAVMAALGSVDSNTPIVALVHDCQVLDLPDKVFGQHDCPVDYIVTPTRVIKCENRPVKPAGLIWSLLDADKINAMPILRKLRYREWKAGSKDVKLQGETDPPASLEDEELKMEDDVERKPRRKSFRRGFGRRRGGGRLTSGGDTEDRRNDGDGDSRKVNGSPRRGRGGFGRRGRGGRRGGGSRGDSGRDHDLSGDEKSTGRPRGGFRGGRGGRGGFRPRRGLDEFEGSVYVGSLPRSLRVSDFKGEVRDRKVNPLRVMWRGSSGFAFLNFKTRQEAEDALVALEGLQIEDRSLRLEMAKERERSNGGPRRRRQRGDSRSGGDDDYDEDGGDN